MLALLALTLAGCASRGSGEPDAGPAELATGDYVRSVYAFPVRDSAGVPYDHPFLGGWNLPRPQWVDIDADGDPDLFVQETSNEVAFFEAVDGSADGGAADAGGAAVPGTPSYVWRTDRFRDLDVGEWYRFADMDGDGDPDLLAEQPFSYIRMYRNEGPPTDPEFGLAADSLRDASGEPIFSDRQNIPNVGDIDCDGDLDLLIGRLTGTISRLEESDHGPDRVPRFRHVTDRFENIEIIGQMLGSLHGANTLALADVDGDGDPDLFWGDFFEPGLLLIENRGSCRSPSLGGTPIPFPVHDPLATSGYNAPAFADADGDGDLDLVVGVLGGAFNPNRTTIRNLHYLEQVDEGRFEDRTARFIRQVDVGSESLPALADIDADGDLDLLLANKIEPDDSQTSGVYRFENVGGPSEAAFRLTGKLELSRTYHLAPAFGDLDADGDLDLVAGSWRDELAFWRNDGSRERARWVLADSALVEITRGSNTVPALGDLDGDGDLDLMIGESSGAINYYRNDGDATEPRFVLVSDEYGAIDVGRRSAPALVDIDGDGDLDLVVGSESDGVRLFRNRGDASRPDFVPEGALPVDAPGLAAPAFGDLDADGDPDLFLGGVGGGLRYFERRGGS